MRLLDARTSKHPLREARNPLASGRWRALTGTLRLWVVLVCEFPKTGSYLRLSPCCWVSETVACASLLQDPACRLHSDKMLAHQHHSFTCSILSLSTVGNTISVTASSHRRRQLSSYHPLLSRSIKIIGIHEQQSTSRSLLFSISAFFLLVLRRPLCTLEIGHLLLLPQSQHLSLGLQSGEPTMHGGSTGSGDGTGMLRNTAYNCWGPLITATIDDLFSASCSCTSSIPSSAESSCPQPPTSSADKFCGYSCGYSESTAA